jgi:peroxiredoxin
MKNIATLLFLLTFMCTEITAQNQEAIKITPQTVILDPEGTKVSLEDFMKNTETKEYTIQPKKDANGATYIQLIRLSDEDRATLMEMERQRDFSDFNGVEIPYFELTDSNGNSITTESVRGKVVVFNFWFTTCPPCIQELPELNELYEKYKDNKDIVFAAITFEKYEKISKFLEKYTLAYPVVGEASNFSQTISRGVYPTNVIIGRDGVIQEYISGGMIGISKQIEAAIQAAL